MRKMLKLRGLCHDWIRYEIGNGDDAFLWIDYWHPLGGLYQRFGEGLVRNRGQALNTKVSSIIVQGNWCWLNQRNRVIQHIMRLTPTDFIPSPSNCDRMIWTLSKDGKFSVKTAWEAIRHKNPFKVGIVLSDLAKVCLDGALLNG